MTKFSLREHDILLRLEGNSEMDSASQNPPTPGSLWASQCRSSCSKLEPSSGEATLASWKLVEEAPLRAAVRIQLGGWWRGEIYQGFLWEVACEVGLEGG